MYELLRLNYLGNKDITLILRKLMNHQEYSL